MSHEKEPQYASLYDKNRGSHYPRDYDRDRGNQTLGMGDTATWNAILYAEIAAVLAAGAVIGYDTVKYGHPLKEFGPEKAKTGDHQGNTQAVHPGHGKLHTKSADFHVTQH